ncbi:hypothetical protein [Spongiactinospora sp. TRM90649]|uniref:hypothetical protein n=1 Tax=Spongiactinospora sp. TRM90649 TaxID=3031114 RepID=UPI0023F6D4B1|nr:hypothetical protein [Spongiactinospora sp. TRM90649]MDF5756601.1 hypothetical protein [Spongiactinospora sp. TRM90649]
MTYDHPWSITRWLLTMFGVIALISLLVWGLGWVTQPFRTAEGVREQVADPDNAIFQYEKFHDACARIVTLDQQQAAAKKAATEHDERSRDKPDPIGRNADESARLHQVADGLKFTRQAAAQQYNADSRKWTQDLFKGRSLPFRITDDTPACDG